MCQHKNIITLVDIFESPDNHYLVLEYVSGGDLFEYLSKRNYSLSEERTKHIVF
jgi:serine/threonine protein kinase